MARVHRWGSESLTAEHAAEIREAMYRPTRVGRIYVPKLGIANVWRCRRCEREWVWQRQPESCGFCPEPSALRRQSSTSSYAGPPIYSKERNPLCTPV